jgi:hypothetical protein
VTPTHTPVDLTDEQRANLASAREEAARYVRTHLGGADAAGFADEIEAGAHDNHPFVVSLL